MPDTSPSRAPIRFGVFELDPDSGELRKQGLKVKLQEQPFQILQILLENPGRVVSREELRQRVWPSDTFVDFDHGVYNAIQKLRDSLDDAAESPRFIETLARRGYRFIAAVTGAAAKNDAAGDCEAEASIAVLPFLNLSADAENEFFADGITEEIINVLSQVDQLRVAARTSSFLFKGKHADMRVIGEQLNVRTVLEGSVRKMGGWLRITAQLVNVSDGYHLWSERYDRELKDVFAIQDEIARCIGQRIERSLAGGKLVRHTDSRSSVQDHGVAAAESLAVLPFANGTGDPETDYLSDGITETIINNLSRLPNLRVIARNTVFRYKSREVNLAAIRWELGVRSVVTGRVVQRGENLVVSAELVDAASESQLWGERYDRKLSEIFSVQEEIATHISEKLRPASFLQDKKLLTKSYTVSREAYQLYLRGRYHLNRRTRSSLKPAMECFERAITEDPGYALAHAGLAEDYNLCAWYGLLGSKEALERDLQASLKAAAIEPELAETQAALGFAKCCSRDWAGGEAAFLGAIRFNQNYGLAFGWYGLSLSAMGRWDEAVAAVRRAQEIDPLSLVFHHFAAWIYLHARRYEEAIDQCREALDMEPGFPVCHFWVGLALTQQHKYEQALTMLEKARESLGTSFSIAWLGNTYARSGCRDKAEEILRQMESPNVYFDSSFVVDAYHLAVIYVGLGKHDQALQLLERAYEESSIFLAIFLRSDATFDVLRADPRFTSILRRTGVCRSG